MAIKTRKHSKKCEMTESEREHARRVGKGWEVEFKTSKQYIEDKLVMLRNEMYINPTDEEVRHLKKLKTEADIDRAVHSIIDRHWE